MNRLVFDPIYREIANFLYKYANIDDCEIEAKLGILRWKKTEMTGLIKGEWEELHDIEPSTPLPRFLNETTSDESIISDTRCYFDTSIDLSDFKTLNGILLLLSNQLETGKLADFTNKIELVPPREIVDSFYEDPDGTDHIRVSRITELGPPDQNQLQSTSFETMRKVRIDSLTVSMPHFKYDLRISASIEEECFSPDQKAKVVEKRHKERYSYRDGDVVWDLSLVKDWVPETRDKTVAEHWDDPHYEVEMEITDRQPLVERRAAVLRALAVHEDPVPGVEAMQGVVDPLFARLRALVCLTSGRHVL
ncbi:mRNA capping enzyme, beta chain [Carpediemonas membranifera]|uniref:mRNA 5'-phosphatase n=1 Tax=Carpediemonas membranifera TaxID=201153 RepID=A0A8J6AXU1_9EUKA|nr:mRNA capping enzyme, beta chain [Carpediemonas membranifera]|eukprot:KAG9394155.1 mRNA capping enzyme, beta chain [Carpediemonas membranifera]